MNLLNSGGNCLFIVVQVIQTIVTEFSIFNLQNIFTTEFESILASILKMQLCNARKWNHTFISCIYTTFYFKAARNAIKKHDILTYFGLLSFKVN